MKHEVAHDGFFYPEGLAWSPDSQTLILTEAASGLVYRVPSSGEPEVMADIGGGANNVVLAADGGCVVAQNGGIDMGPFMQQRYPEMEPLPPVKLVDSGLVYVSPDGEARVLASKEFAAPNDIVVAPDGSLIVTDPGNLFVEKTRNACVRRVSPSGEITEIATGFNYCNGLAQGDDELILSDNGYVDWAENDVFAAVYRLLPDGSRETIIEYDDREVDGVAIAASGRIYVARQDAARVEVLEDGEVVEVLEAPSTMITNICFGGSEHESLFASDARNGALLVWEGLPDRGRPDHQWDPASQLAAGEK
jgi:gluconolactonase